MAQSDLEAFIRERASSFDESMDTTSGSPFDVQVIQPIIKRLGTDPFTVDFAQFAQERLNQEFPDLATKEGDALTDLVIKTNAVLWAPILREVQRVQNNLSFRDPSILTLDEAEALGANLFSDRNRGTFGRGQVRIYFAQPQSISISPANFTTSKSGLHFYPDSVQSIRSDEMILNTEGTVYYFDINVIAEKPGDQYNIGPDEMVSIANISSAVRLTNKRRFRFGTPDETTEQYVGRTEQELSERSLVTLRGIGAQITKAFPEVSRLAVVGFNDPEMQRDIIEGGGYGPLRAFGFAAMAFPDGENQSRTRQVDMTGDGVDFTALIGPAGSLLDGIWYLTLIDAFGGDTPRIRDIRILKVVGVARVSLEDQVVFNDDSSTFTWMLRKKEITVSGIPGGILFPDGTNGTVAVPDGGVHIGGTTDVFVRGADFDTSSLVVEDLVDESPILSGTELQIIDGSGNITLNDLIMSSNYVKNDSTYKTIVAAKNKSYSLQIIDGPAAGSYRVIDQVQTAFASPILTLQPSPPASLSTDYRWRLLDEIDFDLVEPRETRITAHDGISVQHATFLESGDALDFQALGVSVNDTLRILNGPVAGDYTVKEVLAPFFTRIKLDRALAMSASGLSYTVFRPNTAGGVVRPLIRVTSVDLLDTSSQPVGSTIPYAKPVDIQSRGFANVAHGVRVDVRDATLGIVSKRFSSGTVSVSGQNLQIGHHIFPGPIPFPVKNITFTGTNPLTLQDVVDQINGAFNQVVAFVIDGYHIGIASPGGESIVRGGTARPTLFGGSEPYSSRDIRSATVDASPIFGWAQVSPAIDEDLDVLQVVDGFQIGFYSTLTIPFSSTALTVDHDFAPEVSRHIQMGSRSIGTARLYFLEPTTIEFDDQSRLTTTHDGIVVNFKPDPTNDIQKVPGLPNGTKPIDGVTASVPTVIFSSAGTDFVAKAILPGDELSIDYIPLTGSVALADPVPNLALKTIILSVDGGPDKPVTYLTDSISIASTDVTRGGVATQINRVVGKNICSIVTIGALQYLRFVYDGSVVVRRTGSANALLGFSTLADQNNDSPNKGTYTIVSVTTNQLTLVEQMFTNKTDQGFKIFRPGGQRISSTQMSKNVAETGLYYFDLQMVSEGTGDIWNIDAGLQMTATGYDADGYYLTADDPETSFSPVEGIHMHLSRSFLPVGVSDDPGNAIQLSGQNIQVNYERSDLTSNVNNFLTADTERVVNENPLGRHLTPYFVRFDLIYNGGSKENIVVPEIEDLISGTFPNAPLSVASIEKIVLNHGATAVQNPIELLAAVHNKDREIQLVRSEDQISTGRLAAFIPDVINVTRKLTT